jgi:hypothetical protein
MTGEKALAVFENFKIRRVYDEKRETWYFSVVDIVAALIQQPDYQTARKYWNKLKERLRKEGGQSVTNCHQLKLPAADGKSYRSDVADPETLLRIIQSVPSPRAEPIKLWLAKVGYERIQDMGDPARSLDRAREYWQQHGRSEKWIQQRMMGQESNLTELETRVQFIACQLEGVNWRLCDYTQVRREAPVDACDSRPLLAIREKST